MLKQVTNHAPGLFGELNNLLDAVHVIALPRLESLNHLLSQSGKVSRYCLDPVPLTQPCDFERQITLFFEIVERFDDA